jgi:two-component system, OmpR family, response regulator ResD
MMKPQYTILVVDDEPTIREVVRRYLERDGYAVQEAADGSTALDLLRTRPPDLMVLDIMLPGIDGLSITRRLRDTDGSGVLMTEREVPIIILTARSGEHDRIQGLDVGADDYVTKPFSPQELVARVRAVLRRTHPAASLTAERPLEFDHLRIDPRTREVTVNGQPVILTAKEFDLLWFFASHPRQVFSRDQLLDQVWGYSFYGDPSTVTVHVRRLREKIEPDPANPAFIQTVWGVGYKFEA